MSGIVQVKIDDAATRGLVWLCTTRGMLPGDLCSEIVAEYIKEHAPVEQGSDEPAADVVPPDAMDAHVGRYAGERSNDVNEVAYGVRGSPLDSAEDVGEVS